jgi:hypothetical protein
MKLKNLIKIIDKAYPDGMVGQAFGKDGTEITSPGDTLAEFIAREVTETFDPEAKTTDQLAEALRVMNSAHREVGEVVDALEQALKIASPPC